MSNERQLPDFDQFSRWLVSRLNQRALSPGRLEHLQQAARQARDEFTQAHQGSFEVLQLLAAADRDATLPPEITTPRGFRITLAYDEGSEGEPSSIGVLVTCPPALIAVVQDKTVYLWSGGERFELGQFDGEGKALGILPAGIEITASDFAMGRVKLEAPEA
jgi:hypothetical protein